jgi:hypothetical protein
MISADQLRVGHARLVRHAAKAAESSSIKSSPQTRDRRGAKPGPTSVIDLPMPRRRVATNLAAAESVSPKPKPDSTTREDVSDDEIALALSRLTKLPSKP